MRIFLFGFCCLLCSSCFERGDCLIVSTNQAAFETFSATSRNTSLKVKFDRIYIPNVADFDVTAELNQFRLPLNPNSSETMIIFQYKGVADTIVLGYSKQTRVLSSECGSYLYLQDLEILSSTFDVGQVGVSDPKILTTVAPNVRIYY